ncbi:hypothetical protein K0M31_001895 [Melipona bicolor]|uniref:Uncharacterized protein n=1 Tax=Melipona bicolor TaxID=60889 RepID=A0AA40GGE5_9HYME|nr:hypothetical protein K0M31_001895 [Melipona bicolor]
MAVADQFEESPTEKSARNWLQAHRDGQCGLNGLRTIGSTYFLNSMIQCLEHFTREEVLDDDNEYDREDNNDNVMRIEVALPDRFQIQDDIPENVHVVICENMNSKGEPLPPDIDDAHNAINSDDDLSGSARTRLCWRYSRCQQWPATASRNAAA